MKYIKQILIILAFSLLGEALQALIPLPIPAAIYGLVLLFVALCTGLLKPEHISDTADFLIGIMPLLFVAPTVGLLACWDLIKDHLLGIILITVLTTVFTFGVTGLITKLLRKGGDSDG